MRIEVSNDDFGAVVNCAIRYACGRHTYMPGIVIQFVSPLLSQLSPLTLMNMEKDILKVYPEGSAYDEEKAAWMGLLQKVQAVMKKRRIHSMAISEPEKRNEVIQ